MSEQIDVLEEPGKGSSEEKEGKEGSEQLILGRFKTADDLANSYKELEAKFTQDSQEKSELKKQLNELQTKINQTIQPPKKEEPIDLDTLFWEKPSEMLNVVKAEVQKLLAPIAQNSLETQKAQLRNDPVFKKYEEEIDTVMNQLPQEMRSQPGMLGELFALVKGKHQDDILKEYKEKIRAELEAEREGAIYGSLEEPSSGETFTGKGMPRLSDEEKRIAEAFNPDVPKAEAHKKYAEKKAKLEKEDRRRMQL